MWRRRTESTPSPLFQRLALVLFLMATKVVWMLVQAVRTALPIRKDLRMSSDDILNCRWRKSFGVIDADDCVLEPFRIFRPSGPQPILELPFKLEVL